MLYFMDMNASYMVEADYLIAPCVAEAGSSN